MDKSLSSGSLHKAEQQVDRLKATSLVALGGSGAQELFLTVRYSG